jgi:mercuric ion transport protein
VGVPVANDFKFSYLTPYYGTERRLVLKNMSDLKHPNARKGNGFLIAGILSAIGASICCVGPLVLLALGVSGAWIGSLTALEPYRPILIGLTLLFLGFAFYRLYLVRPACSPESAFFETPTGGILDRYGPSAWPNRGTMVCPAVLLIYEIANESFYPNRCGSRTSFQPIGRNLTNRDSRRAKYDLCGLSDHSQKSTLSSAWGNGRQSRFRQKNRQRFV